MSASRSLLSLLALGLVACTPKVEDTAPEDGQTTTADGGSDTGTTPTPIVEDADGDGIEAGEDCDDANPYLGQGEQTFSVDLVLDSQEAVDGFCMGACTVHLDGSLRIDAIDGAAPGEADLAGLACLSSIRGDLNIGAGSTLSKDAPDGELTVARAKQVTVKGWKRPTKRG